MTMHNVLVHMSVYETVAIHCKTFASNVEITNQYTQFVQKDLLMVIP